MKDIPYRVVLVELYYPNQEEKEYATTIESIDETSDELNHWFSYTEFLVQRLDIEFYKRMKDFDVVEDYEFIPDNVYLEWV